MTDMTSPTTPQLSLKLAARLFPDDAKFDVESKDQFHLFTCQIVNTSSDQTYRIAKWGTPLMADEFFQPLLKVVYKPNEPDSEVLSGDYFHIKKRTDLSTDFVTLAPGKSSEAFGFRLIDIFQIKKAGPYSISMSCHFRSIEVSDPHSPSGFGAPITTFSATSKTLSLSLNVTGTPTSVQVFHQLASPPATKDAATNAVEGFALKPPVFTENSTDPDRKAEIERAHQAAYFMAKVAVRELAEGPSAYTNQCLMTWFGTSTDTQALEAILNSYRKIVAVMESENVIYDFSHPQTADSDNDAFVTGIGATWNKTIYVAAGFWSGDMNMSGPDSLAGTIIHELAHGVDMAQDFAEAWYGAEPTKRLAKLNMKANIVHADAIARFSEALNPFSGYWRDAKTGKL